jgi:phage terminase large subunit-like protein
MSKDQRDISAALLADVFGKASPLPELDASDGDIEERVIINIEQALDLEGSVAERPGNTLSHVEKVAILEALQEAEKRLDFQGHFQFFPDEGPYAYSQYKKHLEFLKLGATHRERMFMAGNRTGKSITGGYEMACHLTGMYPHWWEGKRFLVATDCWGSGDTSQTTRDIVQSTLLGEPGNWGTGLIPKEQIIDIRMRAGVPGAVDTVRVLHTSGYASKLGFKSYDQKRRAFQGTTKHVIWLDEEPPLEVYGECLIRTMTSSGVVYVTFTPLMGITMFVQEFLDAARESGQIPY